MSQTPAPTSSNKKPSRPRRWRRRIVIGVVTLLALAVVFRLLLHLTLPTVLEKVGAIYGVDISYERQELTLLGGDAGLWFVKVTPKSGGQAFLTADYVRGNISVLQLLRGRLAVWRVEADGADLTIERAADGSIPLLQTLLSSNNSAPAAPEKSQADAAPAPIDLTSPLRVDALRLNRVRATIRDRAVSPEFAATVQMNLRLSDLGSKDRATKFEVDVWSDPLLDSLRIEGEGQSSGRKLDADMRLSMRGLHLGPVSAYLAPLGLRPAAQSISAQARATISTDAAEGSTDAVSAAIELTDLSALADDGEAAALDKLALRADSIDMTASRFASLLIDGARLNASRTSDGTVRIAGIDLVAPSGGAVAAEASPPVQALPAPSTRPAPYRMSLADFRLSNVMATFRDDAVADPVNLAFIIDTITSKDVPLDATDPQAKLALAGTLSMPGIVQTISLDGVLRPYGDLKTLAASVTGRGVRPDALKPYLDALGIESLYQAGEFTASVDASLSAPQNGPWSAGAKFSNLQLRDQEQLVAMGDVVIDSLGVDPATGRLRVAGVDVSGPILTVRRETSGAISAVGLRYDPGAPRAQRAQHSAPPPSDAAAPATRPSAPSQLPRMQIDRFAWKDVKIRFEDLAVEPARTFELADAGVELKDLVLDVQSTDAAGQTGRFRAWLSSPGLAERLAIQGSITPAASAIAIDGNLTGDGLSPAALASYLQPLGIEPTLKNGTLAGMFNANVARVNEGLRASAFIEEFRFGDAAEELLAVDALLLSEATLGPESVDVKLIRIDKPRARLGRDADGALTAGGMRIKPPATNGAAPPSPAGPTPAPSASPAAVPIVLSLQSLQINDAAIAWTDRALQSPVETSLRSTLALERLIIGKPAEPATFAINASVDGAVDSATLAGTLDASPDAPALNVDVNASGVRAGALAAYLPPGTQVSLRDGRFVASVSAAIAPNSQGGNSARLEVKQLDFRDGQEDSPIFALDSVALAASRIDPQANVYAVDEISVQGVQTRAAIAADGAVDAMGITLRPVEGADAPPPPPAPPADAFVATTQPSQNVADLVQQARKPMPLITLAKLNLNLKQAAITNLSQPGAAPLALSNWTVRNLAPISLGGENADAQPPIEIEIAGAVDPLAGSVLVKTRATPLAIEPAAQIDIDVRGIRGDGLTEFLPQLSEQIDGGQLTDGRFQTHIELSGKLDRRGGAAVDLDRGFDLNFLVSGVEFRNGENAPILAGVESIQSDGIRIEPAQGNVHVKTMEITKPMGYALRDAEGIHVLGWIVKLPAQNAEPPATAPIKVAEAPAQKSSATAAPSPSSPGGEIRIDRLLVSGIDLTLEDRGVTPVMRVPLNALDVEVRDLTNRALTETRFVRFNAVVNAGKIELPRRTAGGGIAGAVGDIGALMGGKSAQTVREYEQRELFSQAAASGRVALYPLPMGYAKASVSGLELAGLAGPASQAGVTLDDGVFDATVDVRMPGDGDINTRSKLVMTDLAVSEPKNGPISRHLALPAPLDAVIDVLQDADGSITLPVSVQVKQGELRGIASAAAGAVSSVIVTAFANAPMKVAGGVTGLIGLSGQEKEAQGPAPVVIEFPPGYTGLTAGAITEIDRLLEMRRKDPTMELTLRHELCAQDVERATIRANPTADEAAALARQVRDEKARLLQSRQSLSGQARSELATLPAAQSRDTIEELVALDRQIALTEDALDELYEMLRPGADRQAPRRTRAAALTLGRERLEQVQSALLSDGGGRADSNSVSERVRITNPQFQTSAPPGAGRVTVTIISTQTNKSGMFGFLKLPWLGK